MSDTYYSSTQAIGKVKFNDNRHRPPRQTKAVLFMPTLIQLHEGQHTLYFCVMPKHTKILKRMANTFLKWRRRVLKKTKKTEDID